jgi:ABC-type Mn2+/Zn2+ transport system permease subunit
MNGLALGFWGILDQNLQWIGRVTAGLLLRRHSSTDDGALHATIGGALVCMVFGGGFGFALFGSSRDINTIYGTILGCLLGVCTGIIFGASVESIDKAIKDLLRSFNSK